MHARKLLFATAAVAATLLASACDDESSDPKSVTGIAQRQIAVNTTDSAQPIDVNALAGVAADTDDTAVPAPVD